MFYDMWPLKLDTITPRQRRHTPAALTCYFQRRVVTDRLAQIVAGHTHVAAVVGFAPPAVDDAQEEEGAGGEQHAVRAGVVKVGLDVLAVFVPFHCRRRAALRLAVESCWFPFGHDEVRGVLYDLGREVFLAKTRPWRGRKVRRLQVKDDLMFALLPYLELGTMCQ